MNHIYKILFFLISIQTYAQLETAHWRFGFFGGLNFISGTASAASGSLYTNEGCASISDNCGNLLFYTDGKLVFSRDNSVMQNGNALLGDASSTQSAIIIPKPDNPNIYYIFTTYSLNGLHYSVVDMSLNAGLGGIVPSQKNIPLALSGVMKGSEKLTAVANSDHSGYWILTHYIDKYYAFSVTAEGVNASPVISQVGIKIPDRINNKLFYTYAIGQLKTSPDGTKIAAAHFTAVNEEDFNLFPINYFPPSCLMTLTYGGALGLYDFDNETGVVSNETLLNQNSNERRTYYGVEFSPDSQTLYSSYDVVNFASECAGDIITQRIKAVVDRYDLTAASIPASENVLFQINDVSKSLAGSLQLALDGNIYHAMYSSLSYIANPNDYAAATFHQNGISMYQTTLGLPPFIASLFDPKILINNKFSTEPFCLGTPMAFRYEGCPDTIIAWEFGDGITSALRDPSHTYANSGTYTVTLIVTAPAGNIETKTRNIEIVLPPNAQNAQLKKCPNLDGSNVTFDLTEAYPLINPAGVNVTFSFYLSEMEARDKQNLQPLTLSTTSTANFWVRVENEWDCFSIVELELLIHSIPNFVTATPITICANNTAQLDIITDPRNTVNWFDTEIASTPIFSGNSFSTPVLTATNSYWVEVSNGFCTTARSEVVVEVTANPQINTQAYPEICEGQSLTLTAITDADIINWYLTNGTSFLHFTGPSFETGSLNTTTSFWVEAVNSVTGCKSEKKEVVVVVNLLLTPTFTPILPICEGESLQQLPINSLEGIIGSWSPALDNSQTTTYTFTPNIGQCATFQTLEIRVNPLIVPTFNPILPTCSGAVIQPLPANSLEGITGTWSPAINNSQTTTYTFTPNIGQCATVQTLKIDVNPSVTPTFNAVAPICSGATLQGLPNVSLEGITGTWSPALNNTQTILYTFTPNVTECATSQTLKIIVNPFVTPTFNPIAAICSGESLQQLPSISLEGIIGSWSPALNNAQTTTYTFTPNAGQCTSGTVSMNILINPLITPVFNIRPTYCQNAVPDVLPLISDNGIAGTWFPSQIDAATVGTAVYEFSPNPGQCTAGKVTINITVTGSDRPIFAINTVYCQNAIAAALPTISDNGIVGSWSPSAVNTSVLGLQTYTFISQQADCSVTYEFELRVEVIATTTPIFELITDYYFLESPQVLPTVSINGITGIWYPSIITESILASGAYRFVPESDQCAEEFSITLNVVNYPKFFTPNNDGYHDSWNISALGSQSNAKILIFNRFGKILTTIKTHDSGWDGTYNGEPLPADDYWFVLTYLNKEGFSREFRSHFTLKR